MTIPFPPPLPGNVVAPQPLPAPVALTDLQRKWCSEFTVDFNAGKAGVRCGMSADWGRAMALDQRTKPVIAELCRRYQDNVEASITSTLENLAIMTRVKVADYFVETWHTPIDPETGEVGEPYLVRNLKPMSEWTDDMHKAIESIKATKYGWEIKLCDKLAANVQIGRFFNMFADTTKLVGPGGGPLQMIAPTMSPEEAAQLYADTLNGGT